jgi:hypothetical protein
MSSGPKVVTPGQNNFFQTKEFDDDIGEEEFNIESDEDEADQGGPSRKVNVITKPTFSQTVET